MIKTTNTVKVIYQSHYKNTLPVLSFSCTPLNVFLSPILNIACEFFYSYKDDTFSMFNFTRSLANYFKPLSRGVH